MAGGAAAAKLRAEAAGRAPLTVRLGLQPAWTGMADAWGAGPVLVRAGKPVFRSLEDLTNDQVTARDPRAAVGQLADGRIVLVAVDGDSPGYSVGLTSYELAKALVGLGAVTAGAASSRATTVDRGVRRTAPVDARPPARRRSARRCSSSTRASTRPDLPLPLLTGEAGRTSEPLVLPPRPAVDRHGAVAGARRLAPRARDLRPAAGRRRTRCRCPRSRSGGRRGVRPSARSTTSAAPRAPSAAFRYDTTLTELTVPRSATRPRRRWASPCRGRRA